VKRAGAVVNLEADLVARYLKVFADTLKGNSGKLRTRELKKQGF
jgi:riboflavin synthase alpha subunit